MSTPLVVRHNGRRIHSTHCWANAELVIRAMQRGARGGWLTHGTITIARETPDLTRERDAQATSHHGREAV